MEVRRSRDLRRRLETASSRVSVAGRKELMLVMVVLLMKIIMFMLSSNSDKITMIIVIRIINQW